MQSAPAGKETLFDHGSRGEDARGHGEVAIIVSSVTSQRLLESLVLQLELVPAIILTDVPELDALTGCELIIADEPVAASIRAGFHGRERYSDGVNPAVIAIRQRQLPSAAGAIAAEEIQASPSFEGLITLPQDPGLVLAQLSVALYAYRAFVRRYRSAFEELHLNRRIFRSVTSGISVADAGAADLPLVYVNPAFELMTGYSLEEVQGRNCRFLQGSDRDQPGLAPIREALAARREVVSIIKNYRKDGTSFWNELSMSPIRNRDGEVTHIVGIQQDVTARVEFEAALRESEKLAAVGRLAASIAHEINNPLESVTNLIYLARHASEHAQVNHYLDQADRELHRASQITTQSLRFYRQSTRPMEILPGEILEAVLDLYQAKLLNAGIRVERRERSTDAVLCLESEIRQVLTNLIRNAIDAMTGQQGDQSHPPRLLVRTRSAACTRSGLPGVILTVADTGTGIAPDAIKHLYKAFFTTKGIGGTGLGLWVSAEIVDRHNGSLHVRSSTKPGRSGTVFQLFLPYQGINAQLTPAVQHPASPPAACSPAESGTRSGSTLAS